MPRSAVATVAVKPNKSSPSASPKPKSKLRKCKARGCKVEFTPTGPRQVYHDAACKDKEAHRRQRAIAKQTKIL